MILSPPSTIIEGIPHRKINTIDSVTRNTSSFLLLSLLLESTNTFTPSNWLVTCDFSLKSDEIQMKDVRLEESQQQVAYIFLIGITTCSITSMSHANPYRRRQTYRSVVVAVNLIRHDMTQQTSTTTTVTLLIYRPEVGPMFDSLHCRCSTRSGRSALWDEARNHVWETTAWANHTPSSSRTWPGRCQIRCWINLIKL